MVLAKWKFPLYLHVQRAFEILAADGSGDTRQIGQSNGPRFNYELRKDDNPSIAVVGGRHEAVAFRVVNKLTRRVAGVRTTQKSKFPTEKTDRLHRQDAQILASLKEAGRIDVPETGILTSDNSSWLRGIARVNHDKMHGEKRGRDGFVAWESKNLASSSAISRLECIVQDDIVIRVDRILIARYNMRLLSNISQNELTNLHRLLDIGRSKVHTAVLIDRGWNRRRNNLTRDHSVFELLDTVRIAPAWSWLFGMCLSNVEMNAGNCSRGQCIAAVHLLIG
jgi:hypothetical protein